MSDNLLPSSTDIIKHLNQLNDIESVQTGKVRQFNTVTFSFKNDGKSLDKSIIAYIKDSDYSEQKTVVIGTFEFPIKVPLNKIEVIQYKYGNTEYAVCFNIDPQELYQMQSEQIEAYSIGVFAKLHKLYLLDLNKQEIRSKKENEI